VQSTSSSWASEFGAPGHLGVDLVGPSASSSAGPSSSWAAEFGQAHAGGAEADLGSSAWMDEFAQQQRLGQQRQGLTGDWASEFANGVAGFSLDGDPALSKDWATQFAQVGARSSVPPIMDCTRDHITSHHTWERYHLTRLDQSDLNCVLRIVCTPITIH
jgi:hypothetical protein